MDGDDEDFAMEALEVPWNINPLIVGKGGCTIKELSSRYGEAMIHVPKDRNRPAAEVTISGKPATLKAIVVRIHDLVKEKGEDTSFLSAVMMKYGIQDQSADSTSSDGPSTSRKKPFELYTRKNRDISNRESQTGKDGSHSESRDKRGAIHRKDANNRESHSINDVSDRKSRERLDISDRELRDRRDPSDRKDPRERESTGRNNAVDREVRIISDTNDRKSQDRKVRREVRDRNRKLPDLQLTDRKSDEAGDQSGQRDYWASRRGEDRSPRRDNDNSSVATDLRIQLTQDCSTLSRNSCLPGRDRSPSSDKLTIHEVLPGDDNPFKVRILDQTEDETLGEQNSYTSNSVQYADVNPVWNNPINHLRFSNNMNDFQSTFDTQSIAKSYSSDGFPREEERSMVTRDEDIFSRRRDPGLSPQKRNMLERSSSESPDIITLDDGDQEVESKRRRLDQSMEPVMDEEFTDPDVEIVTSRLDMDRLDTGRDSLENVEEPAGIERLNEMGLPHKSNRFYEMGLLDKSSRFNEMRLPGKSDRFIELGLPDKSEFLQLSQHSVLQDFCPSHPEMDSLTVRAGDIVTFIRLSEFSQDFGCFRNAVDVIGFLPLNHVNKIILKFECPYCDRLTEFYEEQSYLDHLSLDHFWTRLSSFLSTSPPHNCPLRSCNFESVSFHDLVLHYGSMPHRKVGALVLDSVGERVRIVRQQANIRQPAVHCTPRTESVSTQVDNPPDESNSSQVQQPVVVSELEIKLAASTQRISELEEDLYLERRGKEGADVDEKGLKIEELRQELAKIQTSLQDKNKVLEQKVVDQKNFIKKLTAESMDLSNTIRMMHENQSQQRGKSSSTENITALGHGVLQQKVHMLEQKCKNQKLELTRLNQIQSDVKFPPSIEQLQAKLAKQQKVNVEKGEETKALTEQIVNLQDQLKEARDSAEKQDKEKAAALEDHEAVQRLKRTVASQKKMLELKQQEINIMRDQNAALDL